MSPVAPPGHRHRTIRLCGRGGKDMSVLDRFKIKTKFQIIIALMFLALVLVGITSASIQRSKMLEERETKLRNIVETVYGVVQKQEKEVAAGKQSREAALARIREIIYGMRYDNGQGYLFVDSMTGTVLVNGADPSREGLDASQAKDSNGVTFVVEMIKVAQQRKEGTVVYNFPKPGGTEPLPKLVYVKLFEPWQVFVGTGAYIDDINAEFRTTLIRLGLVCLALLGLAGGLAVAISHNIVSGLNRLGSTMTRLAGGDWSVEVTGQSRKDEVGAMALAVQVFKENAQRVREMEREQAEAKAKAEEDRKRSMLALADSFEAAVMGLVKGVSGQAAEMRATAQTLASSAEQASGQASTVAAAAQQTTANVQTVASATEELSSSISEISRQVAEAAKVSTQASEETALTNTRVESLARAADKIGEIVGLINDIASQTNLLALNATIEAARAGDAGKGFAVVAGEVKNLANQTGRATEEISGQITAVQDETRRTVDAIRTIGSVIEQVRQISAGIASAVEQQGAATQEIARNVHEAAKGTQDVSQNIVGISQSVNDAVGGSRRVLEASNDLARNSETMRGEVTRFLETVRAG
ncbi:MAG: HAMP domain-containing protein [Telmatospirillum sp.]|nr:HAMP domain-containing protein [Telmatospirillum sp.]